MQKRDRKNSRILFSGASEEVKEHFALSIRLKIALSKFGNLTEGRLQRGKKFDPEEMKLGHLKLVQIDPKHKEPESLENPYILLTHQFPVDSMKKPGAFCRHPTPRTDGLSTASLNCHGVARIESRSIRAINERTNAFLGPIKIKAYQLKF